MPSYTCCDGFTRRDFVRIGALTGFGVALGLRDLLALDEAAPLAGSPRGTTKSAIFVRLGGGPSHMDTFDLKPDAPDTHRGEFKPIATNAGSSCGAPSSFATTAP